MEVFRVGQFLRTEGSTHESLSPLSVSRHCCSPAHTGFWVTELGQGRVLEHWHPKPESLTWQDLYVLFPRPYMLETLEIDITCFCWATKL